MPIHWGWQKSACWPVIHLNVTMMCGPSQIIRWTRFGYIEASIIIMAGEFDIIKRGHTAKLAKANTGSQKIMVNGRDTYCANDKPDVVKKIILQLSGKGG
jgi:hypothetical protein